MNQCLRGRPRLLAAASPGERAGQSLVELALILPILLVIMLGALNIGLAIRAQLQLAQLSQQAAQYLVHHPTYADEFVVTISGATGGTFTLTTSGGTGGTTAGVAYNATPATVQAALATLPDVNGVGNVTVTSLSAGGPFSVTFRGTATATGLTASGASLIPASATATTTGRYNQLVTYMNGLSSYQLTPLEVSVTVGTSTNPQNSLCSVVGHSCVQQDTVTVRYPFPVIFPLIGKLSVGMLRGGAIQLGATASTVAATHPVLPWQTGAGPVTVCSVSSTNDCPDLKYKANGNNATVGQHEILWNPPVEAGSLSLPLSYCIERQWSDTNGTHDDKYYDASDPPVNSLNCVAGHSGNGGSGTYVYFIDTTDLSSATLLTYTITTIQADGLQSPAISGAPS